MHRTCSLLLLLALIPSAHAADEKDPSKTSEPELIWISRPDPGARLTEKMNTIILPKVDFDGATLEQAIEYLRQQSRALDKSPGPPESKGVKIILRPMEHMSEPSISLDLKDVPLSEALRYVTELAQLSFRVEEDQVIVAHPHSYTNEIRTRTFKVPPGFMSSAAAEISDARADPFALPAPDPTPSVGLIPRKTAQRILESAGVIFPEGTSASYNSITGLLKVTNFQTNLDLVEAFCDSACVLPAKILAFNLTLIEAPGELIRQINADASKTSDASQHLTKLLDLAQKPGSSVRVAGQALIDARSGTDATTEAMYEPWFPRSAGPSVAASASPEVPPSGLRLKLSPTVNADGLTIDLGLDLELSPPPSSRTAAPALQPAAESPAAHLTSNLAVRSGFTKLVGITKPPALQQNNDDVLCAAFLTSAIRYAVPRPRPLALDIPPTSKPPAGMSSIAFRIPAGLFESIMEPRPKPLRDWLIDQGVTVPPGAKMELQNDILHVTNTEENIETVSALIDAAIQKAVKTVAVTLHTVRLPAAFLPRLSLAAVASNDQSKEWQEVEAAAARGEARFLESCFFETTSGTRATHKSVRECCFLDQSSPKDKSPPGISLHRHPLGSFLEIEPTLSADGKIMDVVYLHEMHVDAGASDETPPQDHPQSQDAPLPAPAFRTLKTRSRTTMTHGAVKLIALHQDLDPAHAGHIWATFLRCSTVPQFVKPAPVPATSASPKADDQALETKTYRVPPDFLQRIPSLTAQSQEAQADPFAPGSSSSHSQIFEPLGVSFPMGSSAAFDPKTSTLIIRNTPANHALIAAVIQKLLLTSPCTVAITTHVLQGPGPLLHRLAAQASSKSDHRAELDELLAAVKSGTVLHLDTARLETKPGTRATVHQGREHKAISELTLDAKGQPVFKQDTRHVGLNIELEPTTSKDSPFVNLVLSTEYHTAPPFEHREQVIAPQGRRLDFPLTDHFTAKTTTSIPIPSGTVRLLSLYKPTGKPDLEKQDILQAIFITCDILRPEE